MSISRTSSAATSLSGVFTAVIAACVLSLSLVGCSVFTDTSVSQELDAYAASERTALPSIMEQYPGVYSDITVETKSPNTIVFTYVYAAQPDPIAAKKYFNGEVDNFQGQVDDQVFPAMENAGVTGTKHVQYVYKNPDGSTIWEHDFASK